MAALRVLLTVAAMAVFVELATATNYTVGAPGGSWDLNTNLAAWAQGQTFKVGDNLVFSYSPSLHDVLEVTKANYDSCTTTGPMETHKTGNDLIPLAATGKRYFICGIPGHCQGGMKVEIDTVAASGPSPPSPSAPSPSAPSPSAPSPPTPSAPSPSGPSPPTPSAPSPPTPSGPSPAGTPPSPPSGTTPSPPSGTTPSPPPPSKNSGGHTHASLTKAAVGVGLGMMVLAL